ncbi:MAG: hypothetical protein DSM106950_22530 [Stigonema ocellatum SAG 48.90 = DSM 106950]|nr:hypothetical protein [Stigonema ocellatum SAG 48.90 = DSM 106950]
MSQENDKSLQIEEINKLKPIHFADLIRAAQLIFDPAGGVSGRYKKVDWLEDFGIPVHVVENLKVLGQEYRYASPHVPVEIIWSKLTPETRIWFMGNKDELWKIEEAFPALDED